MRRFLCGGLTAALVLVAACDGGTKWQEFSSKEGQFSVKLPGVPKKETSAVGTNNFEVEKKPRTYSASYTDMAPGQPFPFDKAVDTLADYYGGMVLKKKDFTLGDATGREFEILTAKPKGYGAGRMILINDRLYQYFVLGPDARLSDADVKTFLNSFKLAP